jgi:hypothetical protein
MMSNDVYSGNFIVRELESKMRRKERGDIPELDES